MIRATAAWALAVLLPLAAGCHNPDDYSPTAPAFQGALELEVSTATLPADGFSRAALTARITPTADTDKRTVVLTVTAGTVVGSTAADGRSLMVTADESGVARAQLQSSRQLGTATVEATVQGVDGLVRRATVDFVAVDPDDIIRLAAASASAPADDATRTTLTAEVAAGIPAGSRTVSFTTNLGTFAATGGATASAEADASNRVSVDLVSPAEVGEARITASVDGTSAEATVVFTTARPETVLVATDKFQLRAAADDSTQVTVTLVREVGTPTAGATVTYAAVDPATGADLGFTFRNRTLSDASGEATATLIAGDTPFRGTATVRASVGSVTGSTEIQIVDP